MGNQKIAILFLVFLFTPRETKCTQAHQPMYQTMAPKLRLTQAEIYRELDDLVQFVGFALNNREKLKVPELGLRKLCRLLFKAGDLVDETDLIRAVAQRKFTQAFEIEDLELREKEFEGIEDLATIVHEQQMDQFWFVREINGFRNNIWNQTAEHAAENVECGNFPVPKLKISIFTEIEKYENN